jgi:hypothetical protein
MNTNENNMAPSFRKFLDKLKMGKNPGKIKQSQRAKILTWIERVL